MIASNDTIKVSLAAFTTTQLSISSTPATNHAAQAFEGGLFMLSFTKSMERIL